MRTFNKNKECKNLQKQEILGTFIEMNYMKHIFNMLVRRTASDKSLHDKAFAIVSNPNNNGYKKRFASTLYKFFEKI